MLISVVQAGRDGFRRREGRVGGMCQRAIGEVGPAGSAGGNPWNTVQKGTTTTPDRTQGARFMYVPWSGPTPWIDAMRCEYYRSTWWSWQTPPTSRYGVCGVPGTDRRCLCLLLLLPATFLAARARARRGLWNLSIHRLALVCCHADFFFAIDYSVPAPCLSIRKKRSDP